MKAGSIRGKMANLANIYVLTKLAKLAKLPGPKRARAATEMTA